MKKLIIYTFSLIAVAFLFPIATYAAFYVATPSEGTYLPGSTVPITIKAGDDFSTEEVSGISLWVTVEGGGSTVVDGSLNTPLASLTNDSKFLGFGICNDAGNAYTSTDVCVDFGARGDELVEPGDTLLTFRVKLGNSEGFTEVVLNEAENKLNLVDSGVIDFEVGDVLQDSVLASFEISQNAPSPTTTIPDTSLGDSWIGITAGFLVVILGAGFYVWRSKTVSV